jgi:hypothetical protein
MKNNIIDLLKYINDYTEGEGECPTFQEMSVAMNTSPTQIMRWIRAAEVLKLLLPIRVRDRYRLERNHRLSDIALELVKLPIYNEQ